MTQRLSQLAALVALTLAASWSGCAARRSADAGLPHCTLGELSPGHDQALLDVLVFAEARRAVVRQDLVDLMCGCEWFDELTCYPEPR